MASESVTKKETDNPINNHVDLICTENHDSKTASLVSPCEVVLVKREFPVGSIVCISGRDLDYGRWKNRSTAPKFYGCVEDVSGYNTGDKDDCKEGQSFVTFVVAGYYEWYNKNTPNVLQSHYDDDLLTMFLLPPTDLKNEEVFDEDDVTRFFTKTDRGWLVKSHEAPCYGCGDPWCLLHNDRRNFKIGLQLLESASEAH